jgi:hydroxyacylglutathione hydrolase
MIVKTMVVGQLEVNCYLLACERTQLAIVIDPGDEAPAILAELERGGLHVVGIVATHGHFDHVMAARPLQEATGAPFSLSAADGPLLAAMGPWARVFLGREPGPPPDVQSELAAGDSIEFGDEALEVRATPGHSPGSVTLVDRRGKRAFTGDALFAGAIGRTQSEAEHQELLRSIWQQIMTLPDDFTVWPGHGPATSVGEQRLSNPFLQPGSGRRGS